MDRFLESSEPMKKTRSKAIQGQLNACRERIRQITETKVWLQFVTLTPSLIILLARTF